MEVKDSFQIEIPMAKALDSQKEIIRHQQQIVSKEKWEQRRLEELKSPKVELAPNAVIAEMLASKQIDSIGQYWVKERVINFAKILCKRKINITMLRSLSFRGIPSEVKALRPIVWKILLGFFPLETKKWEQVQASCKKLYYEYRKELIVEPDINNQKEEEFLDHPLSIHPKSIWNRYFKDQELWEEIEKDVKRTRSDIVFFFEAVNPGHNANREQLQMQHDIKKTHQTGVLRQSYIETHADVMSRILFIYGKLNPGIKYVQGMNEILAVLYYTFWQDQGELARAYFESDLFFTFTNLMAEIRDGFLRSMDSELSGINGKIQNFELILRQIDEEVAVHLEENSINPQFYSLRWLMLLLSQEFEILNVMRLWDTLFADHERFKFLNYACVGMVLSKKEQIMEGDFSECMEVLQRGHSPDQDSKRLRVILELSKKICQKHTRKYDNFIEK